MSDLASGILRLRGSLFPAMTCCSVDDGMGWTSTNHLGAYVKRSPKACHELSWSTVEETLYGHWQITCRQLFFCLMGCFQTAAPGTIDAVHHESAPLPLAPDHVVGVPRVALTGEVSMQSTTACFVKKPASGRAETTFSGRANW